MPASAISVTRTGERSQNSPTPTPPLAFFSFPLSQWRGKVFGFPKQTPHAHVVLAQPSLPVGERWKDRGVDGERGSSCAGREPDRSCLNWGKESSVWAGAQMRTGLCCGERTVFMFFLCFFWHAPSALKGDTRSHPASGRTALFCCQGKQKKLETILVATPQTTGTQIYPLCN